MKFCVQFMCNHMTAVLRRSAQSLNLISILISTESVRQLAPLLKSSTLLSPPVTQQLFFPPSPSTNCTCAHISFLLGYS